MTRIQKAITDDGNVVIGPRILLRIGIIPIGCLMDRIRITHIRRFGIIRIAHFMDTAGIITVITRPITATTAVIIRIETSIGGITVGVGIPRFHGALTKKAIYGLKIDVREVHAA